MTKESVVVRSHGSFRTEVEAGAHRWILDEPKSAGGADGGPTPYDMLAAAIGGCTAMTLHFYAQREKLPLESVEVTVTHQRQHARDCADCLSESGYISRFRLELRLGGSLSDEQKQTLLAIAKRCPVAKSLEAEVKFEHALA